MWMFFNGGFDSSLYCLYVLELLNKKLKTFSIGFHFEEEYDESKNALSISKFIIVIIKVYFKRF